MQNGPTTTLFNKLFLLVEESTNEKEGIFLSVYTACKSGQKLESDLLQKKSFIW